MSSSKVVLEPPSTSFSPLRPPPRSRTSGLYPPPMSSSISQQNKFPRPTLFISCSSSSSSLSSDSSADEVPSCSSSASLSVSQSTGARRPLPQVPCPSGSQPYSSVKTTLASSSSSPASPSSAVSISSSRRPRRALPAIPPTGPTHHYLQIPSRNVPVKASSSLAPPVPSSSTSSSTPPNLQLYATASHKDPFRARIAAPARFSPSSTNAQASSSKHPPPTFQMECAPARLSTSSTNAQASSSKHPPPKIQVECAPARFSTSSTNAQASSSKHKIQTDSIVLPSSPPLPVPPEARRPVLRVQTLVHPDDPLSTIHRPAAPAILVEPPSRPHPQLRMRRSSLDSQTTRFTTLLTPDQSLSPVISKRPRHRKSRKGSQSTITLNQVHSAGSSSTRSPTVFSSRSIRSKRAGGLTANADADEDLEQLSPMEFEPGEHHDSGDEDWGTVIEDADDEQKPTIVTYRPTPAPLPNSALVSPTADEVINRRLNKLRRRVGDTAMREFNVGVPGRPGTGPRHRSGGLGRVVASEGEDDSSDEDNSTGYKIEDEMTFADFEYLVEDEEDGVLVEEEPENPAMTATPVRLTPKTPKVVLPVLARHVGDLGFLVRSTRRSWSRSGEDSNNLPKTPPPYSLHICTCGRGSRCSGNCPSSSPVLEKKNFGRGWFRTKGGKKWEEQDLNDVLSQLRKL